MLSLSWALWIEPIPKKRGSSMQAKTMRLFIHVWSMWSQHMYLCIYLCTCMAYYIHQLRLSYFRNHVAYKRVRLLKYITFQFKHLQDNYLVSLVGQWSWQSIQQSGGVREWRADLILSSNNACHFCQYIFFNAIKEVLSKLL